MTADNAQLVPANLRPGMVATGFAEAVLARATQIEDPIVLYAASLELGHLAQKWNGHGDEKNEIKAAQMFVEIELGQRLGPNPGQGTRSDLSHAISPPAEIPQPRVSEFQRFHGWRDQLLELVRIGKRSRRSLVHLVLRAAHDRPNSSRRWSRYPGAAGSPWGRNTAAAPSRPRA